MGFSLMRITVHRIFILEITGVTRINLGFRGFIIKFQVGEQLLACGVCFDCWRLGWRLVAVGARGREARTVSGRTGRWLGVGLVTDQLIAAAYGPDQNNQTTTLPVLVFARLCRLGDGRSTACRARGAAGRAGRRTGAAGRVGLGRFGIGFAATRLV